MHRSATNKILPKFLASSCGSSSSSNRLVAAARRLVAHHHHHHRFQSTAASADAAAPIAAYDQSVGGSFPSLVVSDQSLTAAGSFAQAQAVYLHPDAAAVQELTDKLTETETGIVAHYYMDVELQGVLTAAGMPDRIGIADSLRMGDMAVEMARAGNSKAIICLGVDFMSESVRAILNKNGFEHIPVYRAASSKIGCSLAEAAERDAYRAWLQQESTASSSNHHQALHVVYINTSLETKAVSNSIVPTITCTSSNVLPTILQASAEMPDCKILYGPDTYMGHNLETMLNTILLQWDDDKICTDLHPQHNRDSIMKLRDNLSVFPSGMCVVHHMFGASVVDAVKRNYDDAYVTAHLEVPGEMFEIAMQKSLQDCGVVGSTSDILKFITRKVQEQAAGDAGQERLKFILGTEAGMVTQIVKNVQSILRESPASAVEAEIIFPVAQDAVMGTNDDNDDSTLSLVPGVAGGEGCSTAGGCATCPFMKMNHLDAVLDVLDLIQDDNTAALRGHLPPDRLSGKLIDGQRATDLGTEPILYMRQFMKDDKLPTELVQRVRQGGGGQ